MSEKYIKLPGVTDEASNMLNDAVELALSSRCRSVSTAHLAYCCLTSSNKEAKQLSKKLNIKNSKLGNAYSELAEKEEYGKIKAEDEVKFVPEMMTDALNNLLIDITKKVRRENSKVQVTVSDIVSSISNIVTKDHDIKQLLSTAGANMEVIEEEKKAELIIPDGIAAYVEDLNTKDFIKTAKLSGVDNYVDKGFEVLSRKTKANPCFIGPAGVGKTSIVYALVQRIINGTAPKQFKDTHIIYMNGAGITSGTRFRGDFEERMTSLINWAKEENVILFLDEIHAFIDAGKSGESDASGTAGNIIKKDLSDGTIKVIGTTTLADYHKYIETDSAFKRRLQSIEVKEPTVDDAIKMINDTITSYEEYHGVKVTANIIEKAVKLSGRYMKDQYLPDKAYTVLDDACARTKLAGKKTVTEHTLYEVISANSGVDITKLSTSDTKSLLSLEKTMSKSVIGQNDAVVKVSKAIRRAKAGTREENKPIASFLFVGPTGVGKTELCKVLSETVMPGRDNFIRFDMSEFSEKYSASKFVGSAPGYIGYGEGGQLTEKVKHNPYSLILFDEIEKADPSVFNIFLQILDDGRLTDGSGDTVDFTNCVIVMTSNAGYGAEGFNKNTVGFGASNTTEDDTERKDKMVRQALEQTFKPEFLNRIDEIVTFNKLDKDTCREISKLMLSKLAERLLENKNISVNFSQSIIDMVTDTGFSEKYGARNLRRKIQDTIEDTLSCYILDGTMKSNTEYTVDFNKDNKEVTVR